MGCDFVNDANWVGVRTVEVELLEGVLSSLTLVSLECRLKDVEFHGLVQISDDAFLWKSEFEIMIAIDAVQLIVE